jgi:glycosyltransferase involved in cell wall biosynthesis
VREILEDGEASWFTAGDPDSLRRALEYISAHPAEAQRQGELMRRKAYDYTWQARAMAVKNLAEHILAAARDGLA